MIQSIDNSKLKMQSAKVRYSADLYLELPKATHKFLALHFEF